MAQAAPPASGNYMRLSPAEYKQALRVFYQHSDHQRMLAQFLQAQVLPALGPPASPAGGRRMLDVGAGDASLAARLLPLFPGGVLAVDCNAALLLGEDHDGSSGSSISGSSSSGPPASDPPAGAGTSGGRAPAPAAGAITKIVADFLQLGLPEGERYDLVLASHVLYQMPPAVIAAFIQKMRSHCAPGGRVLVALGAPRGNLYAFEQELQPSMATSADITAVLHQLGLPFSVAPARDERNHVGSEEELRLVLRFLAEARMEASAGAQAAAADSAAAEPGAAAAERAAAVIERCVVRWPRGSDGSFLLHEDEDYILIG